MQMNNRLFLLLLVSSITFFVSCTRISEQKRVEEILNVSLDETVKNIHVIEIPSSTEFQRPYTRYTTYIRADMPKDRYETLVKTLELPFWSLDNAETKDFIYSLAQFRPTHSTPDWWNPTHGRTEMSAEGSLKHLITENWIIATYENGTMYIKIGEEALPIK